MRRRVRLALAVAVLAVVATLSVAACGSDTAEISPSAAEDLGQAVEDVRAAVDSGDVDRARELLGMLRTTVVELATTGGVTGDRALEINQAIASLDDQLAQTTTTTTRAPTTTTSTTTTRPATTTTSSTTSTTRPDEKPGKDKDKPKPPKDDGPGKRDD